MYPDIPPFNPTSPKNSGEDDLKRLGYLGLSSPRSGGANKSAMDSDESQLTPLPQSPQRYGSGQGSTFGLSPLRLFKFGQDAGVMEDNNPNYGGERQCVMKRRDEKACVGYSNEQR